MQNEEPNGTQLEDVVLSSTTSPQAELEHATSPEWREQYTPPVENEGEEIHETPATESVKTEAESGTAKTGNGEGKNEGEEEVDDSTLPKGVRKRLDAMRRKLGETERKLEEATKAKPSDSNAGNSPASTAEITPANDPEPKLSATPTADEIRAHNRWSARQALREESAQRAVAAQEAQAKQTFDAHLARIEEAVTRHPDFHEVVNASKDIPLATAGTLAIVESENSGEIMYHLAKNPSELERISKLTPLKQAGEIYMISRRLNPSGNGGGSSAAVTLIKKTNTPPPPTPVRTSTSATPTSLDDPAMDTDTWLTRRNEAARRSRR